MKHKSTSSEIDQQDQDTLPTELTAEQQYNDDNDQLEDDGPSLGVDADAQTALLRAEIDQLKKRVSTLEGDVKEAESARLRSIADFQTFRRRSDEQRIESMRFANSELIIGLLPVLDNFERALAAAQKNQSFEGLMGGVELILRQLNDFLVKQGVEQIEAVGQEFDPNFHEAIMRVDPVDQPENIVVAEMQKGYKHHNRVLRPSMVKVAKSE